MIELLNENRTVREIVGRQPSTRRVFEGYGIDYCCGGNQTLEDAAGEQEIDLEALRADLEAAIQNPASEAGEVRNWYNAPLTELTDHIEENHHGYLRQALPRLSEMMSKVIRAHGANHGETLLPLQFVYEGLRDELEAHLMKEEQILFPYIRKMDASAREQSALPRFHCGSVESPIAQMEHEHDAAGGALERMRDLTQSYQLPRDACPTFAALYEGLQELEGDLHEHIHLENNILFPRAIEMERSADVY